VLFSPGSGYLPPQQSPPVQPPPQQSLDCAELPPQQLAPGLQHAEPGLQHAAPVAASAETARRDIPINANSFAFMEKLLSV